MKKTKGVLVIDYKNKRYEIPYSVPFYGAQSSVHLRDKKGCIHVIYLQNGTWELLWPDKFPEEFRDVLNFALKAEFGAG